VKIGSGLRCDSIPKVLIDKGARLVIGQDVEMRRSIEIRVHNNAVMTIGNKVRIDRGVRLLATNKAEIVLEKGVRVGLYSVFNGGDSIYVGDKSLISGFVYLQTSMHGFKERNLKVQQQGYTHAPIQLGSDCWLGTHVVVLPGVKLSKGVVVGSNAVVNRSFEEYKVIGGIPAQELKERK
jgi:acetyltransferase-like isoleucine patch superfamily enzyme